VVVQISGGGSASERDISSLEEFVGCSLSLEFKEFIIRHDGAKPPDNIFKTGDRNEAGLDEFIPVKLIIAECKKIEDLPKGTYPFAWAEGGNYLFIDEGRQGAVFFWDHELPEQSYKVANDFAAFLELLQPFDPSSVELAPGQVRSAWINPDFLAKFSKK